MFEQSLVDSEERTQAGQTRWMVAASLAVQTAVVAGFVAVPLMWPAVLPVVVAAPRVASVIMPRPRPQTRVDPPKPTQSPANTAAVHAPSTVAATIPTITRGGGVIAHHDPSLAAGDAPSLPSGNGMVSPFSPGLGLAAIGSPAVRVSEAAPAQATGPLKISSGVLAGLLLEPIRPAYPAIAKAAGVQGTVVLSAVIDRTGRITGLQVVSGPEMLRRSALEAVQMARYQPFKLNGAPTEVTTTI